MSLYFLNNCPSFRDILLHSRKILTKVENTLRGFAMSIDELIDFYGTQKAACDALGVDRATFSYWKRLGGLPWPTQCQFEVVTGGRLKADPPPWVDPLPCFENELKAS